MTNRGGMGASACPSRLDESRVAGIVTLRTPGAEDDDCAAGRGSLVAVLFTLLIGVLLSAGTIAKTPVVLIYGFQPVPGFYPPQLWSPIAETLSGRDLSDVEKLPLDPTHALFRLRASEPTDRDVFISDYAMAYEPTVRDLRLYAARLADEIAWICEGEGVDCVDIVAFSMGALVARCYIEAEDFTDVVGTDGFPAYETEFRGDVRTLVTLAAPHHGAQFAALGPWFGPLPRQLDPNSPFLALLNKDENEATFAVHTAVRYVSFAGQSCLGFGCSVRRDAVACRRECVEEGLRWQGHDLVVLMSSARLAGAEHVACIGVNHIDMRSELTVVSTIVRVLDGEAAPEVLFASPELEAAAPGSD